MVLVWGVRKRNVEGCVYRKEDLCIYTHTPELAERYRHVDCVIIWLISQWKV